MKYFIVLIVLLFTVSFYGQNEVFTETEVEEGFYKYEMNNSAF